MTERENYLRVLEFRNPDWIPCSVGFSPVTWKVYRGKLEEVVLHHPLIFPDYKKGEIDFATDDPHLPWLIDMLTEYEMKLVNKWLEIGVDIIGFHTDIGTQDALMISPEKFRKYIKPMFKRIFTTCRKAGTHVSLSSDGCLLEIVDDLVECGVSMHDPQLRANTLEGIAGAYKGKMCINLDMDRQMFPFCAPEDIMQQVKESVEKLNLPEGGLMIFAAIFGADVPLRNIEAICQAFEKFCLRK